MTVRLRKTFCRRRICAQWSMAILCAMQMQRKLGFIACCATRLWTTIAAAARRAAHLTAGWWSLAGRMRREPSTDGDVTPKFVCGCIQQVLPSLRPAYAEVLREVDLAEEPLGEYARRHKLTPGNAAVRAHRARAALRAALKKTCGSCTIDACLDCVCKVPITE